MRESRPCSSCRSRCSSEETADDVSGHVILLMRTLRMRGKKPGAVVGEVGGTAPGIGLAVPQPMSGAVKGFRSRRNVKLVLPVFFDTVAVHG